MSKVATIAQATLSLMVAAATLTAAPVPGFTLAAQTARFSFYTKGAKVDAEKSEQYLTKLEQMLGAKFDGHADRIQGLGFAPGGQWLASGSYRGTICLTDVETGREIYRYQAHDGIVGDLEFTSDGLHILSCGHDKLIRLTRLPMLEPRPAASAGRD